MAQQIENVLKEKIRLKYVTSPEITLKKLAIDFDIPLQVLNRVAREDSWQTQREDFNKSINKHAEKKIKKIIDEKSELLADIFKDQLEAVKMLSEVLTKPIKNDPDQFKRHLVVEKEGFTQRTVEIIFDKVDASAVKTTMSTLKEMVEFEKMLKGLLTTPEERRLSIEERKLKIEERKLELAVQQTNATAGDPEVTTGVIEITAQDQALMDNPIIDSENKIETMSSQFIPVDSDNAVEADDDE